MIDYNLDENLDDSGRFWRSVALNTGRHLATYAEAIKELGETIGVENGEQDPNFVVAMVKTRLDRLESK